MTSAAPLATSGQTSGTSYVTRRDAAVILTAAGFPISYATLNTMATRGGGPPYKLFGRVALYDRVALYAWARGRMQAPFALGMLRPAATR